MYAQVEKPKENKSRAVANSVAQKKNNGKQGFGFVDNRPEAIAQRKLQSDIQKVSTCAFYSDACDQENVVQGAFWDSVLLGAAGLGLGYLVGAPLLTWIAGSYVSSGLATFASSLVGGVLGAYEGQDVQTPAVTQKMEEKTTELKVYYSDSLLGHFTMILTAPDGTVHHRSHYVIDEQVRNGILAKLQRKVNQASGFAKGKALDDEITAQKLLEDYDQSSNKQMVGSWMVSASDTLKIIKEQDSDIQISSNYGYVTYSSNVENCGSYVVKMLGNVGISITLPRYKTWSLLPSLIKNDIVSTAEKQK